MAPWSDQCDVLKRDAQSSLGKAPCASQMLSAGLRPCECQVLAVCIVLIKHDAFFPRFVAFSAGSVDGRARRPHCITYTAFFRNFSLELIKNFLHLKHSIKTPTQFRHSLAQRDDLPHRVENLVCHLQQLLLSSEHTFTIVLQQGAV